MAAGSKNTQQDTVVAGMKQEAKAREKELGEMRKQVCRLGMFNSVAVCFALD